MLPLISVWERDEHHPCGATQGFGVCPGMPGNPRAAGAAHRWRKEEKHVDKVRSANGLAGGAAPAHGTA